jgi:hypothetical protein
MTTIKTSTLWPGGYIPVEYVDAPFFQLAEDEVFVFGSNATGFHAAGAAGMAFRGSMEDCGRNDPAVQRALIAPPGHPNRLGRWAVFGVGQGFQAGHEGKSYAIQTLQNPGFLRNSALEDIFRQLADLCGFARRHQNWTFIVTPIGEGHAGYTAAEMQRIWRRVHSKAGIPANMRFIRLMG